MIRLERRYPVATTIATVIRNHQSHHSPLLSRFPTPSAATVESLCGDEVWWNEYWASMCCYNWLYGHCHVSLLSPLSTLLWIVFHNHQPNQSPSESITITVICPDSFFRCPQWAAAGKVEPGLARCNAGCGRNAYLLCAVILFFPYSVPVQLQIQLSVVISQHYIFTKKI